MQHTQPFFIVSSGRSGTQMLEKLLGSYNNIEMHHEYKCNDIQPLAVKYSLQIIDINDTLSILENVYSEAVSKTDKEFWGDSSNKLSWLIPMLDKLFPNAKFIHLIRDPRDNWASLKSGWKKRYQRNKNSINELLFSLIFRLSIGYEMSDQNSKIIGKNRYKIIKYEDLVTNPELIMREISDFLQIDFSNKMLKTTNFGYLWKSNNFEGISKSSPLSFNVGSWHKRTSKHEIQIIEFYFKNFLKKNN